MADQDNGYGFPDDAGADEDQSIISVRLIKTQSPLSCGGGETGLTVTTAPRLAAWKPLAAR